MLEKSLFWVSNILWIFMQTIFHSILTVVSFKTHIIIHKLKQNSKRPFFLYQFPLSFRKTYTYYNYFIYFVLSFWVWNTLTSLKYTFPRLFGEKRALAANNLKYYLYFLHFLDNSATVCAFQCIHYYFPTSILSISYS